LQTIEEHLSKGIKATRFPDGYELIEQDDGLTVDRAPDGSTNVTHPNGLQVQTYADGGKKITTPEGKVMFSPPPPKIPPRQSVTQ
jgi:hypothetical protein